MPHQLRALRTNLSLRVVCDARTLSVSANARACHCQLRAPDSTHPNSHSARCVLHCLLSITHPTRETLNMHASGLATYDHAKLFLEPYEQIPVRLFAFLRTSHKRFAYESVCLRHSHESIASCKRARGYKVRTGGKADAAAA